MNESATDKINCAENDLRAAAERLVFRCGVRADLKGYTYLTDAVSLFGKDTSARFCDIYGAVGALHGLNRKTIMREINYAIAQAFEIDIRLSALTGINVPRSEIHGSLVIAYLGRLCKYPWLSPQACEKDSPTA